MRFGLQKNRPRSVRVMHGLIGLGIALSVAALLVTLGVAGGFEKELKKSLLDFHAHITIDPNGNNSLKPEELTAVLEKIGYAKEVESFQPFLYREALAIHQGVIKGVVLKGIPLKTHDEIILGNALAEKFKTEKLKLLIPKGKEISTKNTVSMKVAGTFKSGIHEIDQQFVLIDLKTLQKLFGLSFEEKGFEIKLRDPALAIPLSEKLKALLPPFLLIQSWADLNRPLLEAFALEKMFFWILIGFMIVVSILNLIGAILLAIFRKKKTIAILRALGVTVSGVRSLFASEGFVLGFYSVGAGMVLGGAVLFFLKNFKLIPIDPEVYFLEKLPIHLSSFDILAVGFFSLLLVFSVSIGVASRVASIPIREGLHGPG